MMMQNITNVKTSSSKIMKRLLTLFTLILSVTLLMGQKLTVDNFVLDPTDLTASTQRRNDNNGDACALIKVQLARPGATFHGNVMGDTPYSQSEYFVYMMKGSKMLQVKLEGYIPVKINFTDYGYSGLESLSTYVLSITLPNVVGQSVDDGKNYFSIAVTPPNAVFILDGEPMNLDSDGVFSQRLMRGKHRYQIKAIGYSTEQGEFDLGMEKVSLRKTLKSSLAQLTIECPTLGVDFYVNDEKMGSGTSWTGSVKAGDYLVEARKMGHITQQKSITLADNQTLKVNLPALVARVGQLDVNFKPLDAEVWIDGAKVGTSPDLFKNVTIGSHRVEIRKEGYQSETKTVTIAEGQTASLSGSLAAMTSSASSLDVEAMYKMGEDYYNGRNGKAKDYAEAVKWYRKAAEQGYAQAQNQLDYMYQHSLGVTQDYAEAVKWYRKAAEQGDASGQNNLGYMYQYGYGVAQDYAEAVKLYRKAAEQGKAYGQNGLGYMYHFGLGVTRDYAEAVKWYRKSARQGNAFGQNQLGYMYQHSLGVTQDYAEAVKWYRKSAEQGNAYGQYDLGYMYQYGYGVAQDYAEAVKWYRKSAEQGYAYGQYDLGMMYYNGTGVKKDLNEAKIWFQKAAAQGYEGAKNMLEKL